MIYVSLHSYRPEFRDRNILRAFLDVLARELSYSYTLDQKMVLPLWRKVVLFDGECGFRRDTHGEVGEKGTPT